MTRQGVTITLFYMIVVAVDKILLALVYGVAVAFEFIVGAEDNVAVAAYFVMASLEFIFVAYQDVVVSQESVAVAHESVVVTVGFVVVTCAFVVVALERGMFAHVDVSVAEDYALET